MANIRTNIVSKETINTIEVTQWSAPGASPVVLNTMNESNYLGGLFNKDSETGKYFKWQISGPYPVSRLTVINTSNFQKIINDFGTTAATILLDRNVPITVNTVIPANIFILKNSGCDFIVSSGVIFNVLSNTKGFSGVDIVPNADAINPIKVFKNLLNYSQKIVNVPTVWTVKDLITTESVESPYGDNSGTLIVPNTTNTTHAISRQPAARPPVVSGSQYVFSFHIKSSGYNVFYFETNAVTGAYIGINYNFSTGAIINTDGSNGSIKIDRFQLENGWYRISIRFTGGITGTADNGLFFTSNGNRSGAGNGTSGVLIWGFQFTQANQITAYFKTDTEVPQPDQNTIEWVRKSGTINTSTIGYGAIFVPSGITGIYYQRINFTEVQASWFGVRADGTTDDTTSLQNAINYCTNSTTNGIHLALPQGSIIVNNTITINVSSFNSTGLRIYGKGMRYRSPQGANIGGTSIIYTGPSGVGTKIINLIGSAYFLRIENFSIEPQYNDGVETGFNFESSTFSTYYFFRFGSFKSTFGLKLNSSGTGSNGEFNAFEECQIAGTDTAYWHNAGQALSPFFKKCQFGVEQGGTLYNILQSAGGTMEACDASCGTPLTSWAISTAYTTKGFYIRNGGSVYRLNVPGTSGTGSGPTGTGNNIIDGTATWDYVRPYRATTLLYLSGNSEDPINIIGGRSEHIERLVQFGSSQRLNVNIDGLACTILAEATVLSYSAIEYSGAEMAQVYLKNCHFSTARYAVPYLRKWFINMPSAKGGVVHGKGCIFVGIQPAINISAQNPQQIADNSTQSWFFGKVSFEDCTVSYTTGTAVNKVPFNKVLLDNTYNNKESFKPLDNLLLYSKFTESEGSNISATPPWVHFGTNSTFPSVANLKDGAGAFISSAGKRFSIGATSQVYQDLSTIDITSTYANVVKYEGKFSFNGAGTFRVAFVNSIDNSIIYDESIIVSTASGVKTHLISLLAIVPIAGTGFIRLVLENQSSGSLSINMYHQLVTKRLDAGFIKTTSAAVQKSILWGESVQSIKVAERLQLPIKDDTYGSSATNSEPDGDTYISSNSLRKKHYSDRWEELPRQDFGSSIPVSGTWPMGFIRWNSTPTTGQYIGWVCISAGSPGSWAAFGLINNDLL